jgi:hypothetical protein
MEATMPKRGVKRDALLSVDKPSRLAPGVWTFPIRGPKWPNPRLKLRERLDNARRFEGRMVFVQPGTKCLECSLDIRRSQVGQSIFAPKVATRLSPGV